MGFFFNSKNKIAFNMYTLTSDLRDMVDFTVLFCFLGFFFKLSPPAWYLIDSNCD